MSEAEAQAGSGPADDESSSAGSGDDSGSASGATDTTEEQSLAPADVRAGVKLQAGTPVRIVVKGLAGRPIADGRAPYAVPGIGDYHVLSAEVRSIGDTLMPNQAVRVYDVATSEMVGEGTTDDQGVLRMDVPKDTSYRIEIVDDPADGSADALVGLDDTEFHRLVAKFLDATGKPLASESVELSDDDGTITVTTDENGVLDVAANLQPYQLVVRGQTFLAHALPSADHDKSADNMSVFSLTGGGSGDASGSGDTGSSGDSGGDEGSGSETEEA